MEDKKMSKSNVEKMEALYERYAEYIYRVALKKLRNVESAKDCCQQSYEKLIRYMDRLEDIDSPKTVSYVYLVVHSVAMDMLRCQKKCVVTDSSKIIGMMESSYVEDELNFGIVKACQNDILDKALKVLTSEERTLLMLRFGEDRTYEETGRMMGISVAACRKRVQRIKEKLGDLNGEKGDRDGQKYHRYGRIHKDR